MVLFKRPIRDIAFFAIEIYADFRDWQTAEGKAFSVVLQIDLLQGRLRVSVEFNFNED